LKFQRVSEQTHENLQKMIGKTVASIHEGYFEETQDNTITITFQDGSEHRYILAKS